MKAKKKYLRVAAYFGFLAVVASFFSVRNARAELAEQALTLGRQMHALAGNGSSTEATRVIINGQPVIVGSSVSDEPTATVLDRFEEHCRKNLAQTSESWREALSERDLARGKVADEDSPSYFETGVLRSGKDDGMIVCFNRTAESKPTAKEAIDAFAKTGNLNAFGALRYVYAKPTKSGRGTHVVTVWTEERFDFNKLLYVEGGGDVEGEDFAEVPRLTDSSRIMSTHIDGAPYGVNVYVVPGSSPTDAVKFYDRSLEAAGWFAIDPGHEEELGGVGRTYERDGVVLTFFAFAEGEKTFAALGLAGVSAHDLEPISRR